VNTGCRDQEILLAEVGLRRFACRIEASVFIIPGALVKNGNERLGCSSDRQIGGGGTALDQPDACLHMLPWAF
jgi:hypothetical protein